MKKYEKVYQAVVAQIQSGEKQIGDKLPSIRQMAKLCAVSKNTVLEAYERLVADRYIEARQGSGFYITPGIYNQYYENISREFNHAYERINLLTCQLVQSVEHKPGDGRYPRRMMRQLNIGSYLGKFAEQTENIKYCLGYGDPAGNMLLKHAVRQKLIDRGLILNDEHIMLSAGTNHSYDLIIRHFLSKGDAVLVEAPGYYPLLSKLELAGIRMLSIMRDEGKINIAHLEQLVVRHQPKIFFLQSYAHNPTGTDIDMESLLAIKKICRQHRIILVEDDPFLWLREGKPSVLLEPDDETFAVIYLGSFSKVFSASLRCGFICASKLIIQSLLRLKIVTCVNTSSIGEAITYDLLSSPNYQSHILQLKQYMQHKTIQSINNIQQTSLIPFFKRNPASFYLWCRLPQSVSEETLIAAAKEQQIFLAPGTLFFSMRPPYQAIRLNIFYSDNPSLAVFFNSIM